MNISKLLASSTVAVTVISGIGFAYAQTSPYSPSGATTSPQTQNQGMTPGVTPTQSTTGTPSTPTMQNQSPSTSTGSMNNRNTGMPNSDRTGAVGATTDNMGNERAARADRN